MATRSTDEGGPRANVGLPATFNRRFRPWQYRVSHSELTLRTVDGPSSDDIIEMRFHGVVGMKLKTVYETLTLSVAKNPQANEILDFSGVRDSPQASKVQCLSLSTDDDSFVACLSYSIWARPRDAQQDSSDNPQNEPTLILRG